MKRAVAFVSLCFAQTTVADIDWQLIGHSHADQRAKLQDCINHVDSDAVLLDVTLLGKPLQSRNQFNFYGEQGMDGLVPLGVVGKFSDLAVDFDAAPSLSLEARLDYLSVVQIFSELHKPVAASATFPETSAGVAWFRKDLGQYRHITKPPA